MTLLTWVLAAMALLDPGRDHLEVGTAIAEVVEDASPLFRDDVDRRRTAALVVAVAWRESTFRNDAVSETADFCLLQVHGRPDLADDVSECVRVGLAMLRVSLRSCASHPVAFYAAGPRGCSSPRAQRISRDRMALAGWLVREVQP